RQRRQQHRRPSHRRAFPEPRPARPTVACLGADHRRRSTQRAGQRCLFRRCLARSLAANGRAGDIAVGLSTSGGSENVLRGFAEATRRGMLTIGLAGYDGGKMAEANTIEHLFVTPSASVHRIQEAQTTTYHVLWELTQLALTPT